LSRHVAYLSICYSIFQDLPKLIPVGCYDSTTGKLVSQDGGFSILANVLQPFNDPDGLVCWNNPIKYGFLGLLLALQVLTIIWFFMVLQVAYRVLTGNGAHDNRSDDEDAAEEEELIEDEDEKEADLESLADAGATDAVAQVLDSTEFKGNVTGSVPASVVKERSISPVATAGASSTTAGSSRPRRSGRTSAISLPGHGDRKELLGRIGCDKPA
jgi:very-long-chain ceramide synthase